MALPPDSLWIRLAPGPTSTPGFTANTAGNSGNPLGWFGTAVRISAAEGDRPAGTASARGHGSVGVISGHWCCPQRTRARAGDLGERAARKRFGLPDSADQ